MTLHDLLLDHIRDVYKRTPGMADAIAGTVATTLRIGSPLHDWLLVEYTGDGHRATWFDDRADAFRALGRVEAAVAVAHRSAGVRLLADSVPRLVPVTALLEDVDRADVAELPDVKEA